MIKEILVLITAFLAFQVTARSENYQLDVKFAGRTASIEHDGNLVVILSSSQTIDQLVFRVTNCTYDINQRVKDPKINKEVQLPAKVHLSDTNGVLNSLMYKSIIYNQRDGECALLEDHTVSNGVVGSLSDLMNFMMLQTNRWPRIIWDFRIYPGAEIIISNIPPFCISRRVLDPPAKHIMQTSYELDLVDTINKRRVCSRLVLSNSCMIVDAVFRLGTSTNWFDKTLFGAERSISGL